MSMVAERSPKVRDEAANPSQHRMRFARERQELESPPLPARAAVSPVAALLAASVPDSDPEAEASGPALVCSRFVWTASPLLASDLLSLLACGVIAVAALRLLGGTTGLGGAAPLALLPLALAYWPAGLYPGTAMHPVLETRQVTKVNTIAFLAAAAASLLGAAPSAQFCFVVFAWLASLPLVPFSRILVRKVCARFAWWGYPTLIISSGGTAPAVARVLLKSPHYGLRPTAVADLGGAEGARIEGLTVLGPSEVARAVRDNGIRHAVASLPDLSRSEVAGVLEYFSGRIPHLILVTNLGELPTLWNTPRSCGALNGTELRNGLMLALPRRVKRAMDVAVASVALAVASPFFAAIALLIKLTSRGPVFYGHKRIGLQGRTFRAWKFRSMYADGDEILAAHLASNPAAREEWQRDQKLRDDPRVTSAGRVLRRLSLDEVPQLWNVLRGEMSLVGPRPIVNAEVEKYGKVFPLVKGVKPGITGLWQVSGRNNTTYEQRVRLDQYYVRNWSPWLDAYILAKTVSVVITREGAC
jgi:Undecaprenyl-phosphate galactose phosphotransferase WbaP